MWPTGEGRVIASSDTIYNCQKVMKSQGGGAVIFPPAASLPAQLLVLIKAICPQGDLSNPSTSVLPMCHAKHNNCGFLLELLRPSFSFSKPNSKWWYWLMGKVPELAVMRYTNRAEGYSACNVSTVRQTLSLLLRTIAFHHADRVQLLGSCSISSWTETPRGSCIVIWYR